MDVRKLAEFRPLEDNPNKHTQHGLKALEDSIQEDGWVAPITVAADGESLDGAARLEVAYDKLGEDAIVIEHDGKKPIVMVRTDVPDAKSEIARRIIYRANRVAELDLEWNAEQLLADIDAGIDLSGLFSDLDLENIVGEWQGDVPVEDVPPQIDRAAGLQEKWGTAIGQIWQLGEHRLACGDCTDKAVVDAVMQGDEPSYGMHDPPCGINVVAAAAIGGSKPFGSNGAKGTVEVNVYAPVVGDDKPFDPVLLLEYCPMSVFWGANYYCDKLPRRKGWIVWDKKGRDWEDNFSDCELAWTPFPITTRIYRYVWMGMVQEGMREQRCHPTQKPVGLFENIIEDLFDKGGIIIDFYAGSGPTLLASERLGRPSRLVEIVPEYCAVTIQRWVDLTGQEPKLIQ